MEKICIVSDTSSPHINGVVTTIENLIENLKMRNYEVLFINQKMFKTIRVPFYKEIDVSVNPWLVEKYLKDFKPDYVHIATEFGLGFFSARYCIKNNIPYTSSFHTNWPDYVKTIFKNIPEELILLYLKFIHNNSKKILVTNNAMKNYLENKGFKNLMVWSRGVDRNIFNINRRKNLNFEKPIFLNVGRISKEKNLEDFLNLDLKGTKIIVGDGPMLEKYKTKYSDKNVVFLGPKKGVELAEIYASSDIFVFPSRTDTFGMVLIEAISCGSPVAAYPVTGPSEIVVNGLNGFLDENLKNACEKCLELCDKRVQIYESSKKWCWKNTTDIFVDSLVKISQT